MVKKRVKKFRGSRTHGGGSHKKRRGGGSRGGRGDAGKCKHHFIRSILEGTAFGKTGFKRPQKVVEEKKAINVGDLDLIATELIARGMAEVKDQAIYIDLSKLGIDKLLGGGRVTKRLFVTVSDFSETAKAKLEAASGGIIEA
ncbi:MAG: uL15 family ribosomal protein [Methanocellales archaeon]